MQKVKSTCSYCGVGCGVEITTNPITGEILVEGDKEHPANKGMLCSKGMNLDHATMDMTDRLLYPEMRYSKHLPRQRVSWSKAMQRAAKVFKSLIKNHGSDSVAFYVSGQLLTEEYYIINKLVKGFLGTAHIDTNSRLCMSSAVVGYKKALGEDAVPISYDDIEIADCFFITGANPAWCHPILFRRIEARKEEDPNVKIIVVDPRRTQSAMVADLHLQIAPGTDVYLNHAICRILIEKNKIDENFINKHTDGFESLKEKAFELTLEEYAYKCDIPLKQIKKAAKWIAKSKGMLSMWTMGLNQSVIGVNKNLSLINIHLITGKIGKPGNGPFSLTGQPNAMGGREVGGLSTMLASHMELSNPEHRATMAKHWNVESVADKPGYTATQIIDAIHSKKLKALWVVCTNPLVSLPDARRVEEAMKDVPFLIMQDISSSASTYEYADLVLPAAGYMEKDGVMTNSDRRMSLVQKVINPPGEALADAEIIWKFAKEMGWSSGFPYKSYESIFDEYKKTTEGTNIDCSGVTYTHLKEKGTVQWPFRKGQKEGTKRLFTDNKFYTDNQRAKIFGVAVENQSEALDEDFPFVLTTGRIRDQWHTMTRTGKVSKLNKHIPNPYLEIHPEDAKSYGIEEGKLVEIKGRRGSVRARAQVTTNIKKGVVFLPMHWGKKLNNDLGRGNNLTNALSDPISLQPDFKYAAVNIKPHKIQKQKIAIIGAGAAATKFIQSYREIDKESEIEVFSKEDNSFYNRVLLPDYLYGGQSWEKLKKIDTEKLEELKVKVYGGQRIVKIDADQKEIQNEEGTVFSYDKLIFCTGSRPFIPPTYPTETSNFFTIRQKENIDKIFPMLDQIKNVVVIGGGVLGLEMAGAFQELGKEVSIIQRADRLMERQLDPIASQLLLEELKLRNIKVLLNDEVLKFELDETKQKIEKLKLLSGKTLLPDIVIGAIGTKPNIEVLREAGAEYGRGIKVNQRLETSLKDVYALGEVAELNGEMWGITAAAEQQAEVLVKVLEGDPQASYNGSLLMNILKIKDVNLCSLGDINAEDKYDANELQVIKIEDISRRYYKKCLVYKNKLIGAVLVGGKEEFVEFRDFIAQSKELDDFRDLLLRSGGQKKEPIKGKLVCSCCNVGEGNITEAIEKGCDSLQKITEQTGAGSGCGSCKPEVVELLNQKILADA